MSEPADLVHLHARSTRPDRHPKGSCLVVDRPEGWTDAQLQADLHALGPLELDGRPGPTWGLAVPLVAAALLQVLYRISGGSWLAFASGAALVLPVVGLLLAPRLKDVEVVRLLHGRGAVGSLVDTTLVVTNTGSRRTPALLLTDEMPGHASVQAAVPGLLPGGSSHVPAPREAVRRTTARGGVVRLSATSPVGMVRVRRDVPLGGEVRAHPVPAEDVRLPVPRRPGTGTSARPLPGAGTEVLGLRDWRPGDAARSVHARATARHGRPVVLEREREAEPALVVLVSGGGAGPGWESVLAQTTALALAGLRAGRPLLVLGPPGQGRPGPRQLLDAMAAADLAPRLDAPLLHSACARVGRGGQLVLAVPPDALEIRVAARRAAALLGVELVVPGG